MSKRAIKKKRHYTAELTFKQKVLFGMLDSQKKAGKVDPLLLAKMMGMGLISDPEMQPTTSVVPEVQLLASEQLSEHVHSDHCHHDGAYSE